MNTKIKAIDCDPECGFMIKSHDEKEVIMVAKEHVKTKHDMDVSDMDMQKKIKTI